MSCVCVVGDAHFVYVSQDEISRLREAEKLTKRRFELATSTLPPEVRALQASQIRIDELAYGKRYF